MDTTESEALRLLSSRDVWDIDELPPEIDADILRYLDADGLIDARYVVMQNQQKHRGDSTPPKASPSHWFSPILQPVVAGDWSRIAAKTTRDQQRHPPQVRVSDRGRAAVSRMKRASPPMSPTRHERLPTREWESILKRVHVVVRSNPDQFLDSGRWFDEEYSDKAVKSRRQRVDNGESVPHASAAMMPGVKEGDDSRYWRLNCINCDLQADPPNLSMSSLDDVDSWARRVLLYVALVTDRNASQYAESLTELATLEWDRDAKAHGIGRGWIVPDSIWYGEHPWRRLIEGALATIEPSNKAEQRSNSSAKDIQSPSSCQQLRPSVIRAGQSFEWVCRQRPDLVPGEGAAKPYCFEQWAYIRENGCPAYEDNEGSLLPVPSHKTWERYVREWHRHQDGPKKQPRAVIPEGRSVVCLKDIDVPNHES